MNLFYPWYDSSKTKSNTFKKKKSAILYTTTIHMYMNSNYPD